MNALRKILNNLQKYATTVTTVKNDVNAVTPLLPERQSLEETGLHKETPGSEIGVNVATPQTIDTNEYLKEFDDILEEINKDVTKGASLDDIDEVLKDMKQEDPKDSVFEVPRFDLAEISTAFEYLKDDDVDVNSLITLDDSITSLSDGYIANINEVIEQNDVISISSEDSQPEGSFKNIPTENTGNIEQNIDENSTKTEETKENRKHSESIEHEKLHNKYVIGEKYQGIEKQTTSNETNDVEAKTSEHTDKTNEPNEGIQNNPFESCKEENDLTTKDVIFIDDSDDCGYHSSDFEFITEEEAKMDGLMIKFKKKTHIRKADKVKRVKTIEVSVDQFSNAKKSQGRKKIKRKKRNIDKDPDWTPESDNDSLSDDEFIPDNTEYLNVNNTPSKSNNTPEKSPGRNNSVTFSLRQVRIPPKTNNGSSRFRNLQINSDSHSRNVTEYNVDVIQNNEERDSADINNDQEFSNECKNELVTINMECNDENNLLQTKTDDQEFAQIDYSNANFKQDLPEKVPKSNKIVPGSSLMQENSPDSYNVIIKTNEMQDGPDLNNIIGPTLNIPEENNFDSRPSHSQRPEENIIPEARKENIPDSNMLNPSSSKMHENLGHNNFGPGPSYKRNRSHVDEIEKWRMYQMRKRLIRPQLVVDYSYRDHHRIYQNNDLHQLFDPNRAPLPTARSIRLLENKSTVCKNSMLVEHQGVGFDVPRRDSGSEDDEVKQEAITCAKKILEMYPGPNTRRPRRRF